MDFCLPELERSLAGEIIGHKIYYYEEIGSTNDEAYLLGRQGLPEGSVVIADEQKAGKGRLARSWHSPPKANIYTSILLRPNFAPAAAPRLTIMAGLAVAETLKIFCPEIIQLKWPNDILIGRKKVCGILAQMQAEAGKIDFIVLGIGINVNMSDNDLPPDIEKSATSLMMLTGAALSRGEILINLYKNLSKWYKKLIDGGFEEIRQKWTQGAMLIGGEVQINYHKEIIRGIAQGIDEDGALLVKPAEGKEIRVMAGDASIIKENKNAAGN